MTDEERAYKAGYDCGLHGADDKNCDFRHFQTQRTAEAWQRGQGDGEKAKAEKEL